MNIQTVISRESQRYIIVEVDDNEKNFYQLKLYEWSKFPSEIIVNPVWKYKCDVNRVHFQSKS